MKVLARVAPLLVAAILVAALSAACGGGDDDSANGGGNDSASEDPITITLGDNFFDAKDITIPVNTTVQITVQNDGIAIHNMHVLSKDAEGTDFKSDVIVNPGASSTFEVTFTSKGEFAFQCDYHLPDMVGIITVE